MKKVLINNVEYEVIRNDGDCIDTSILEEKITDYFDPYDVNDIKNKIEKNINKKLDYKKVSNWINQFDWITCSNKFKKIINEIEGEK